MIRRILPDGRIDDPSNRRDTNDLIRVAESAVQRLPATVPKREPDTKVFRLTNQPQGSGTLSASGFYYQEMTEDGVLPVDGGISYTSDDAEAGGRGGSVYIPPVKVEFLRGPHDVMPGNPSPYLTDLAVNAFRKKQGPDEFGARADGRLIGAAPTGGATWYISASLGLRDPSFDMVAAKVTDSEYNDSYGGTSIDQKYWHMDYHVNSETGVADSALAYTSVAGVTAMGVTRLKITSTNVTYAYHRDYKYDSMGHLYEVSEERESLVSPLDVLFAVDVTKTSGSAGGATSQCTFKYTVRGLEASGADGRLYGTNMTPAVQRPPLGRMLYGNGPVGSGYMSVRTGLGVVFTLLTAGEAPDSGACD